MNYFRKLCNLVIDYLTDWFNFEQNLEFMVSPLNIEPFEH